MATFINFCFDDEGTAHTSKLQHILAEKDISHYAAWLSYPPHITLVRIDEAAPQDLIPTAERFLRQVKPLNISLGGLSLFNGPQHVIWLTPVPNILLLKAHSQLCHDLEPLSVHEHYQPKKWMPHATLAAGLDTDKAMAAMSALLPVFTPISVTLNRIEVVSFPPAKVAWSEILREI